MKTWRARDLLILGIALTALFLNAVLLDSVCNRSRGIRAESWSADGRTARSVLTQSTHAVPATAPMQDRPGPQ